MLGMQGAELQQTMQQSYRTDLSPETKQKIDELTRLMNKYPRYHPNSDGVIRWVIQSSINRDNVFLELPQAVAIAENL